jgi:hypothetical protein
MSIELSISVTSKNFLKQEIENGLNELNNIEPANTIHNTEITTQTVNSLNILIESLQQNLQGLSSETDILIATSIIYTVCYLKTFLSSNAIILYDYLDPIINVNIWQYFKEIIQISYSYGFVDISTTIYNEYNPIKQIYYMWNQINGIYDLFNVNIDSSNIISFEAVPLTVILLSKLIFFTQRIIAVYKKTCLLMEKLYNYVNKTCTQTLPLRYPVFFELIDITYSFGFLIGSHKGTLGVGEDYGNGLYSGVFYTSNEVDVPHLGNSILKTNALQNTFLTNVNGYYIVPLENIQNIKINDYIQIGNSYTELIPSSSIDTTIKQFCEYGRIMNIDISTNCVFVEGSFHHYHYGYPSVNIFSMPSDFSFPPQNVYSVSYTTIISTDWTNNKIFCNKVITPFAIQICYIYTLTPTNFTVYKQETINIDNFEITAFELNLDKNQYNYPKNSFVVFYETPITRLFTQSNIYYNQLLLTSKAKNTQLIGDSTMIITTNACNQKVVNGCLLAICGENEVTYCDIDYVNYNTIYFKTPLTVNLNSGTLVHIIYFCSYSCHLPPFHIHCYNRKSLPEGSVRLSVDTLTNRILSNETILTLNNVSSIVVGSYISIDNGELNEYNFRVISINTTTNTITLSAPTRFAHDSNCLLQFYRFYAEIPNSLYFSGMKTIQWKEHSCSCFDEEYILFPGISTVGSISICLYDVSNLTKNMIGILSRPDGEIEYIHIIDVNVFEKIIYINKPLKFNYQEYYGVQFFSLINVIEQSGVSMKNIVFNSSPISQGDGVISFNPLPTFQPGQILSVDVYGNNEITTVYTTDNINRTVQVIPPLNYSHIINSTIVTYDFVIPSVPIGSVKIDQNKTSRIIIPGTNKLYVNNVNNLYKDAYLIIGYTDYEEKEFRIMEIDKLKKYVIVDKTFTKYYYTSTLCQFYKYPDLINSENTRYLHHTYTTDKIIKNTNTLKLENVVGITIGSLLQIGTTPTEIECKTVEDYYGCNVIVDSDFSKSFDKNTLVQLYVNNIPDLPKDSKLVATTFTENVVMIGDTIITLHNDSLCVANETYILLGTGLFIEKCFITNINKSTTPYEITVETPIQNTHNIGCVAQLFKYSNIPVGSTLKLRKSINQNAEKDTRFIYFDTSTLVAEGLTNGLFAQIGNEENLETDLSIIQISTNWIEVSTPLKYLHSNNSVVCVYTYPDLPPNTALISLMKLSRSIKSNSKEIFVDSVKGFKVGMTCYIQVGNTENTDTDIKVHSVNISANSILVSTPFLYNYPKGSTVQLYIKDVPDNTFSSLTASTVVLEESIECGSVILAVSSNDGIHVGMYGLIDIGNIIEQFIVMDVDSINRKVSLNLQLSYSHKEGSVIQFFNVPHPVGTQLIDYTGTYNFIKSFKSPNTNSTQPLQNETELVEALQQYKNVFSIYSNSNDATKLVSPLLELVESRCLTIIEDNTTDYVSAYVPYYNTIVRYYSELTNIEKYNPIPKVTALRFLIQDILNNILPIVENSNGTYLEDFINKIQMVYSIYYQLYFSQKTLNAYLLSLNIIIPPGTPHLNNTEFPVLPFIELSFGCLIGISTDCIGVINEPGTIYKTPYVKNNHIIVNGVARQNISTNPGDTTIVLNSTSLDISTSSIIYVDIGIAQEIMVVSQVNGNSIVFEKGFTFPHNKDTMVFICSKTTPINFVISEFTSEFRLVQNIEIFAETYDIPTSTFMAYGEMDVDLFRNTFLFGTTNVDEFVSSFEENECYTSNYRNVKKTTMGFYIDSSYWNDEDNSYPKLDFSKLKCSNGYYSTQTYVTKNEPELSEVQTSTLIYNIFNIENGTTIVNNMPSVISSMSYTFSKYIWNNTYGAILWSQDYRRKPLDSIITENQTKQIVSVSNKNLVQDPLNPEMYFIPMKDNTDSIVHKLFSQLTAGDIARLKNANLYKGTKNIYHFPFIEGDRIIFKVNVKYAKNNISSIFTSSNSSVMIPQEMVDLNNRFNEGKMEHLDYNSYTVILTLV